MQNMMLDILESNKNVSRGITIDVFSVWLDIFDISVIFNLFPISESIIFKFRIMN